MTRLIEVTDEDFDFYETHLTALFMSIYPFDYENPSFSDLNLFLNPPFDDVITFILFFFSAK